MNRINLKMILEVAKWEFNRWFKLKEQIITLLAGILISILIFGGKTLMEKFSDKEIKIALVNNSNLQISFSKESKINLIKSETTDLISKKKLLCKNEIDGILIITSPDNIELIVNKESYWLAELQENLNTARQKIKIQESNISPEQLQDIFKQAEIKLTFTEKQKEKSTTGEKVAAGIFIGIMLVGVYVGLAYQFIAITGEKQLRITEVIVSAISPQTWIDGKILGISFLSLAMLVTYSLTSIVFVLVSSLFGSGWSLPLSVTNPLLVIELIVFTLAGFFFWNTFFSAIAATINDPNTSARGSLMMLPVIPIVLAFITLGNPDSTVMQFLSVFPLTSAPVITARLVLTDVSFIEVILSLLLLLASIIYLRNAAGKIFSLSILMYGKEPSWKEISRWLRETK